MELINRSAPQVGIVVACHNAERFVAETLDSVRNQTYANWECIVVDDGSTDSTARIADEFAARDGRFRVLGQSRSGVSVARNTGIDAVSADVTALAFLDGDDVWEPDALTVLVDALGRDADAVGVYGMAEYIDEHSRPLQPGVHREVQADRRVLGRLDLESLPRDRPSTFSSLVVAGTIWPSGVVLHHREAVEAAGRFDPELLRAQDWELYVRMSRQGHFRPVENQVAWYRRHGGNATAAHQARDVARFVQLVRWKTWRSTANDAGQRRETERVWRRLAGRWIVTCATTALAAGRRRQWREARDALGATAYLLRHCWHPIRPDDRYIDVATRFLARRTSGSGGAPP